MPKRKAKAIADAAEMIVDGFAVLKQESGYKIVNLNSGNVVVVSDKFKVLESSMDEIEETIAVRNLVDNHEIPKHRAQINVVFFNTITIVRLDLKIAVVPFLDAQIPTQAVRSGEANRPAAIRKYGVIRFAAQLSHTVNIRMHCMSIIP